MSSITLVEGHHTEDFTLNWHSTNGAEVTHRGPVASILDECSYFKTSALPGGVKADLTQAVGK
jgi:hypothetical protein